MVMRGGLFVCRAIVGANPNALIMPVTVLQSDGGGDIGTIIRGLEYCLTHQVDVISMSLGGYGASLAEEMALGKCYHTIVSSLPQQEMTALILPTSTFVTKVRWVPLARCSQEHLLLF